MREQLEIEKEKVTMNVILNIEVERIKNILAEYKNHILQYDELIVRTLIERIRVIPVSYTHLTLPTIRLV